MRQGLLGGLVCAASWTEASPGLAAVADAAAGLGGGMIAISLIVFVAVLAALVDCMRVRQKLTLFRSSLASVPRPRQMVGPKGKVIYSNPAFIEFFGVADRPTPALIAEQTDDEVARDQIARLANNAINGIAGHAEVKVRALGRAAKSAPAQGVEGTNGAKGEAEVEWRSLRAFPVQGRPGHVLWFVDDITLRRQMEQIIQGEQERFADLLEHAPIGFYSVDAEGRFLFANRTLGEWLGYSPEQLEGGGVRLHQVLDRELPDGTLACDPFGAGETAHGEVILRAADGNTFEAYIAQDVARAEDGRVLRTRSVVRHLSEERAMAAALAQSERRFERFFADSPAGMAVIDDAGKIVECNAAMCARSGLKGSRPVGMALVDLVAAEDRAAIAAALQRPAKPAAGPSGGVPIEVRLAGETETVCACFITPMEDAAGAPDGYIAHFIDTTELKSLELQFAQSQKMQAVGQLAGGIAHDFNNLLTAMIGFSDLLLLRHRPGDQSFADIMQIKQNANRAANLVRQLLAFSRQQTLQPKVLSVTDILAELSHLLRRLIGENIELKMVHGRDLGAIKADQGQLEQVVINLAVNARDAMLEGGRLTIRTDNLLLPQEVKHKGDVVPAGDYTRIEVLDTGCGIAKDNLDRIFEPFFSTKEVGAGTGLGLSTVYGIVKQTGGFVFVESTPGVGTTFAILLPHHGASEAELVPVTNSLAKQDLSGVGTVVLVEDEDAVRSFSARALRNKGYKVLEAPSGEAALELLSDQRDAVDLLITDVVMPRLDGPSLVREVRAGRPNLQVIFISGYTEDAFRKRLDRDAGIHFLPKPFSLKQLASKVKEVMDAPSA